MSLYIDYSLILFGQFVSKDICQGCCSIFSRNLMDVLKIYYFNNFDKTFRLFAMNV